MKKQRILVLVLLFVFAGLLFFGFDVKASTTPSNLITVQGAQVRTTGSAGIRFVGKVDASFNKEGVTAYGLSIAFGKIEVEEIEVGGTVNGKSVLSAQVSEVNETNNFYINLTDIPKTMYGQNVTARAYVVRNGEIEYADSAATRNLGQVALAVKAAGQPSDLVTSIVNTLESEYKSVYTDANGNIFVGSAVYEMKPENLETEFVKDWNAKFGTTWTEVTGKLMTTSAATGYSANTDKNPSLGNLYKFFRDTENGYEAKWLWLLKYIASLNGVWPTRQATAIIEYDKVNGTTANTYGLYKDQHLAGSIANFFNKSSENLGYAPVDFGQPKQYATLDSYNNVILAKNPELVTYGTILDLPELTASTGYTFIGYTGLESYNDSYTVNELSEVIIPTFAANEYSIKYYSGDTEIDYLNEVYTIESDVTLPILQIEGYDFLGWYDNSSFTGNKVECITKGTIGDKVYYAKLQKAEYASVNVTYDANGGTIALSDIPAVKTFTVNSYSINGSTPLYMFDTANKNTLRWQYKILLNYDSSLDLYKVVAVDEAKADISNVASSAGVTWTHGLADSEINIVGYAKVGQYISIDLTALKAGTSQTAKVYDLSYQNGFTTVLKESCTLLVPTKENDPFIGWKSSLDGEIVTEFSGYASNPGDITYTAIYQSTGSDYVNVNVTFDTNGGYLSTPVNTFNLTEYTNNATSSTLTYIFDTSNKNSLLYQYKILLNYDSTLNLYKVVAVDAKEKGLADMGVTWTHGIGNPNVDITSYAKVGQYVSFDLTTLKAGTAQIAAVFDSNTDFSTTAIYNSPIELPTPTKPGSEFLGWICSLDSKLYTNYPGYTTNPGTIKYTAQWAISEAEVNEVLNSIVMPNIIHDDMFLQTKLDKNLTATWTSANTSLISNSGVVNKSISTPTKTTLTVAVSVGDETFTKEFNVIVQPKSHFIMDNLFDNGKMENVMVNSEGKLVLKSGYTTGTFYSGEFACSTFSSLVGTWIASSSTTATCELLVSLKVNGSYSSYVTYGKWGLGLQNACNDQTYSTVKMSTDEVVAVGANATAFKYKIILRRSGTSYASPEVSAVTFALNLVSKTYDVNSSMLTGKKIYDVPKLYQHDVPSIGGIICSVTSSTMLLLYKGHDFSSKDSLPHRYTAALFKDYGNNIYGNWVYCCVGMSSYGEKAYVKRFMNTNEFLYSIQEVGPMAASIKGTVYYYNMTTGVNSSYTTAGHLLVVTGYEISGSTTYIYINDPNVKGVSIRMTLPNFLNIWRNVSYIVE